MRKTLAVLPLFALALTGCAANDGTAQLNVRQDLSKEQYTAKFDRALFAETDGQTDIVLLANAADTDTANANGQSVRQVIHLKVLWTPTRTIRLDSPSAGNAMIDWQVIGSDADRVTYAGSCWAKVNVDGDTASVDVREANVSVRQVTGHMTDPLKRATLNGKFVATRSDATVRGYVADLNAAANRNLAAVVPNDEKTAP